MNAVTQDNIQEVLEANNIVLLKFWAEWCAPCKTYDVIYNEVAEQYPDLYFGSVDADKESDLCAKFKLRGVPTTVVIRNEHIVYNQAGILTESELIGVIESVNDIVDE